MKKNVNIVTDPDGRKLVMINDICFRAKRREDWEEVEKYLKEYVGSYYEISETAEKIYIGSKFPNEFAGSEDTGRLRGTLAKAKANMTQGLPQIIEVASNCRFQENMKEKHHGDAKKGWYRYTSNFALPVYDEKGGLQRYNVFRIEMLVRHSQDGKNIYMI